MKPDFIIKMNRAERESIIDANTRGEDWLGMEIDSKNGNFPIERVRAYQKIAAIKPSRFETGRVIELTDAEYRALMDDLKSGVWSMEQAVEMWSSEKQTADLRKKIQDYRAGIAWIKSELKMIEYSNFNTKP